MATILLVEDTPANLALASKLLSAAGHHVLTADSAEAGIILAQEQLPDLVLMDIGLPGMDGYRERALAWGFDGYLSKPIEFSTFADSVASLLP
jgi:two-component system cell cycle response regulator DivK